MDSFEKAKIAVAVLNLVVFTLITVTIVFMLSSCGIDIYGKCTLPDGTTGKLVAPGQCMPL